MEGTRRFLVVLTSGPREPGKVRSAFVFATLAAASGFETVLCAVDEGAEVFVKGVLDDDLPKSDRAPTMLSRMREAAAEGVAFHVCGGTAVYRSIEQEDLVDGAYIVGGTTLVELAVEAEGMLAF